MWSGPTSSKGGGSPTRHWSVTIGQRGLNAHPAGTEYRLGGRPLIAGSRATRWSIFGIDCSRL